MTTRAPHPWIAAALGAALALATTDARTAAPASARPAGAPTPASASAPFPLWDDSIPLPRAADIPALAGVEFHVIKPHEPDKDGYRWLHGVGLAWHGDRLYASFGHNTGSENTPGEQARGCASADAGRTWGPVFAIASGDIARSGVSHGVFLSHADALWSFHGAFRGQLERTHTRACRLDPATNAWTQIGITVGDGFWPLQNPVRMTDGNWIMAGARLARGYPRASGNLPAVALSRGADFTRWDLVVLTCHPSVPISSPWGESTVIVDGPHLTLIARWTGTHPVALASESADFGRTWTPLRASNLPMAASKPHAGLLSTGQRYLICSTTADGGNRRAPLTLAIARPGRRVFSAVRVIRPAYLDGAPDSHDRSALSYPCAVEHGGKLYVGYSNSGGRKGNFNSAELAVIPLRSMHLLESGPHKRRDDGTGAAMIPIRDCTRPARPCAP